MKHIALIIILFAFFSSCQKHISEKNVFAEVENKTPLNEIKNINLEKIKLDHIESSYVGIIDVYQDYILFIDKKFCYIYFFDKNGQFVKRKLGQGQGPKELMTGMIDGYAQLSNPHGFIFIGGGNDCHLYDSSLNVQKRYTINKGIKKGKVNYNTPWIYTLSYEHLIMKNFENHLYYTVYSEYQDLNFIDSPTSYFQNVHYLCKMNLGTGKVEELLGHYPYIYVQKKELKPFNFVDFDIDTNGNFYIAFEADSLIYMYDKKFTPLKTFGYAGKNIKNPKRNLSTFSEFREFYEEERKKNGYYTHIKYIDKTELLFRSYTRGDEEKMDGLQVYKNGTLLGDIDIPKSFHVIGYIPPFYYGACDIDEENEIITIFKFKIEA